MTEERADLLGGLRRKNVLELASLLFDLTLVLHPKALGKEAFGESMTTDDVSRALASARSEFHDHAAVRRKLKVRLERVVAWILDGTMRV
jgi:hypothetical protein